MHHVPCTAYLLYPYKFVSYAYRFANILDHEIQLHEYSDKVCSPKITTSRIPRRTSPFHRKFHELTNNSRSLQLTLFAMNPIADLAKYFANFVGQFHTGSSSSSPPPPPPLLLLLSSSSSHPPPLIPLLSFPTCTCKVTVFVLSFFLLIYV